MRIAYVTADHGIPVFGDKGASIHIQELVRALGNLGHEVVVLAARVGGDERPLGERVIKIRALSELAGKTASDDAATRRLAKERYYIEIAGAVERELHALHAVGGFDLIYERYSLWSAAGVRAARALAVPCVIEMNAPLVLEQRRYRQLVLTAEAEAIEREVLSDARSIAAVSTALRNYAIDNGADPAHVFVLPNGVDTERFHPSGPVASPMPEVDAPVIGFVGSLKPWHGLDTLLDALRTLRDRDVPAHLLIVGDGPLRAWIEGYVSGAGLTDRVTLTGWVGHDAVPSLVRSVDIAVAPYPPLDDFYFSPLKLYEYLAAGRAVVASAIGQVEQAIDDGRTGLLVPAGDPSGLANALERLCRDEPLRRSLGQAAFAAAQGFTWDANARRVIEIAQTLKHAA